ncbi:MAG: NAD(P)-binding domain-containing protein [Deltaproteobacteria bacterium]|nr:NAD(P)-binding domain-containing protein [Deltaproteobacteria bacterium]
MASKLGIYGLSTMGKNLALNFVDKNTPISVFNRTSGVTYEFVRTVNSSNLIGFELLQDFLDSLEYPRVIFLLIKSEAVHKVLEEMAPLLSPDDIVVDLGNSFYRESRQLSQKYRDKFNFIDCGISGGEEGARYGASFMLGGTERSLHVKNILERVAAKTKDYPCVELFEGSGAGHFVKMLHNAIEYAVMQFLGEIYACLKKFKLEDFEIAAVFESVSKTELNSYLLQITIDILNFSKENGILDQIEEKSGQKGTGKWAVQTALDYGLGVPNITCAVEARNLSHYFSEFQLRNSTMVDKKIDCGPLIDLFYLFYIAIYDQAVQVLRKSREIELFNFKLNQPFKVWQAGSILASDHIHRLTVEELDSTDSFIRGPREIRDFFIYDFEKQMASLKNFIKIGLDAGCFMPCCMSVYNYLTGLTASFPLGFNLIQAQRDYFGRHGVLLKGQTNLTNIKWK